MFNQLMDLKFLGIRFLTQQNLILVPCRSLEKSKTVCQQLCTNRSLSINGKFCLALSIGPSTHNEGQATTSSYPEVPNLFPGPSRSQTSMTTSSLEIPSLVDKQVKCLQRNLFEGDGFHLHLYVDVSPQGWGAHLDSEAASGLWSAEEELLQINQQEFEAVIWAISHWAPWLKAQFLMIRTKNSTVAFYINLPGSTNSVTLLRLTFQLFRLTDSINLGKTHNGKCQPMP